MGAIIVAIIALMVFGVRSGNNAALFEVGAVNKLDNFKGEASSTAIIIEYSDFECPACRTYYMVMRQMMAEFGSKAVFVYRYFPLTEIHANAQLAAQAVQAAAKQGKFWEMHDLLFEKQNEWASAADPAPLFDSYASLIGISASQFQSDYTSKDVISFVKSQRNNALGLELQGTPTFFVNGKKIENPKSVEEFRTIIKDAISGKK